MNHDQAEQLIRLACDFQAKSAVSREMCRESYRASEPSDANTLRILVDGQVASLAEKMSRKVAVTTPNISYQIGVSASFIRTHFILTELILNGDLVEALTLTRKQLESLARLHELDSKPLAKLSKKVPNIGNALKGTAGRMYGDLSEVAHFATPRVSDLLSISERGELVGPSIMPTFSQQAGACFDMAHFVTIYFLAWMTESLAAWYPDYDNSEDKTAVGKIVALALKCGVIQEVTTSQ